MVSFLWTVEYSFCREGINHRVKSRQVVSGSTELTKGSDRIEENGSNFQLDAYHTHKKVKNTCVELRNRFGVMLQNISNK